MNLNKQLTYFGCFSEIQKSSISAVHIFHSNSPKILINVQENCPCFTAIVQWTVHVVHKTSKLQSTYCNMRPCFARGVQNGVHDFKVQVFQVQVLQYGVHSIQKIVQKLHHFWENCPGFSSKSSSRPTSRFCNFPLVAQPLQRHIAFPTLVIHSIVLFIYWDLQWKVFFRLEKRNVQSYEDSWVLRQEILREKVSVSVFPRLKMVSEEVWINWFHFRWLPAWR